MRHEDIIKAAAALKKAIVSGIENLDSGRFQTYTDASLMRLADDIGRSGRNRLSAARKADSSKTNKQERATGFGLLDALHPKFPAKVQREKTQLCRQAPQH